MFCRQWWLVWQQSCTPSGDAATESPHFSPCDKTVLSDSSSSNHCIRSIKSKRRMYAMVGKSFHKVKNQVDPALLFNLSFRFLFYTRNFAKMHEHFTDIFILYKSFTNENTRNGSDLCLNCGASLHCSKFSLAFQVYVNKWCILLWVTTSIAFFKKDWDFSLGLGCHWRKGKRCKLRFQFTEGCKVWTPNNQKPLQNVHRLTTFAWLEIPVESRLELVKGGSKVAWWFATWNVQFVEVIEESS